MGTLVKIENFLANPNRDTIKYKIDLIKKASLMESLRQTGWWKNVLVRPKGNMVDGQVATEELILTQVDADGIYQGDVELSYGHHRLAALKDMTGDQFKLVEVPIMPIKDDTMLRIMCNENKEGYGNSVVVMLETVDKVRAELLRKMSEYKDYEAYVADESIMYEGKDATTGEPVRRHLFGSDKTFSAALKNQSIGHKTIQKFLGSTWSLGNLQRAASSLKRIDAGIVAMDEIEDVGSLTILDSLVDLLDKMANGYDKKTGEVVEAPTWPQYLKDHFRSELMLLCSFTTDEKGKRTNPKYSSKMVDTAKDRMMSHGASPLATVTNKNIKKLDWKKDIIDEACDVKAEATTLADALAFIDTFASKDGVSAEEIVAMKDAAEKKLEAKKETPAKNEGGDGEEDTRTDEQKELDAAADAEIEKTKKDSEDGTDVDKADISEEDAAMNLINKYDASVGDVELNTDIRRGAELNEEQEAKALELDAQLYECAFRNILATHGAQKVREMSQAIAKDVQDSE